MSSKRNARWNRLVENTIKRVLFEEDEKELAADEETKEMQRSTSFEDVYGSNVKDDTYGSTVADQMAAAGDPGEDNKFLSTGKGASDAVKATRPSKPIAAKNLNPSQSEVKLGKSLGFAISMIRSEHTGSKFKPGGDLGGIISSEGNIFDGHHRWAGTFLVNPDITCQGASVDLPKEKAIPVLRAIGIAVGHETGNFGGGDSVWSGAKLSKEDFAAMCEEKMIDFDSGQKYGIEELAPGAKKYCKFDNLTEENKSEFWSQLYDNYTDLLAKKPEGVPPRSEMPVLVDSEPSEKDLEKGDKKDKDGNVTGQNRRLSSSEVDFAVKKLAAGEIDTNRFFDEELAKRAQQNESIDIRRWNKLAGLLKD